MIIKSPPMALKNSYQPSFKASPPEERLQSLEQRTKAVEQQVGQLTNQVNTLSGKLDYMATMLEAMQATFMPLTSQVSSGIISPQVQYDQQTHQLILKQEEVEALCEPALGSRFDLKTFFNKYKDSPEFLSALEIAPNKEEALDKFKQEETNAIQNYLLDLRKDNRTQPGFFRNALKDTRILTPDNSVLDVWYDKTRNVLQGRYSFTEDPPSKMEVFNSLSFNLLGSFDADDKYKLVNKELLTSIFEVAESKPLSIPFLKDDMTEVFSSYIQECKETQKPKGWRGLFRG